MKFLQIKPAFIYNMIQKKKSKQLFFLIATAILLTTEVFIAVYIHDDFIRPYVGDVLVVVLLYCFIRIWLTEGSFLLPLYVFLFAAAVEVLQYFDLAGLLGLEHHSFFGILLGSVFDKKDLICYGIGGMLAGGFQMLEKRILRRKADK